MLAIETRQLRHEYRTHFWQAPKVALRGLDLRVEAGEIFGFLGSNGAGKTTTIKILVGLHRQKSGAAEIFGRDARTLESRRGVGFMPENPYFYEYLTAWESLLFYAALCDVPRTERARRAEELLEFVGLAEAKRARVKEFSKGMRQRLGIAQALVHRPRLAILDEPMSGLDPAGRLQVREAILQLKREGVTVFFSSHVLGDVEMICDRVGLLMRGELTASGSVPELLQDRSGRIEVGAEKIGAELTVRLAADAVSTLEQGNAAVFCFDSWDQADAAVRAIVNAGGRITLVRPARETLEEYFMRSTGKSRSEVADWSGGGDR